MGSCYCGLVSAKLPTMTFSLSLRIESAEWNTTLNNMKRLLEVAKAENMSPGPRVMLKTSVDQISKRLKELQILEAKIEAERLKALLKPKFTDKQVGVKPLKKFLAAKKNKGI